MTVSAGDTLLDTPRNNVLPAIRASSISVKLTRKRNHPNHHDEVQLRKKSWHVGAEWGMAVTEVAYFLRLEESPRKDGGTDGASG